MKLFYFVTFFIAYSCSAQSYKFQYYLDENFSSVNKENATFIGKGYNKNELFQLDCFNKITGEFFMSAHFTDSSLNILNGLFKSYYPKQKRENLGYYVNSLEEGIWQRWDSVGNKIDSSNYVTGKKIFSKIFKYSSDNKVYRVEMADSVTNKFHYIDYNTYDKIINDAVFKGENGVVTMYDSLRNITTQNVYSKELIEA